MIVERPESGILIGFEGVSGVGKTYFSERVKLEYDIRTLPEELPGVLPNEIRRALNTVDDEYRRHGYPSIEALLFYSRRIYELVEYVVPYLEAGEIVVQDRAFYSTNIYSAILAQRELSDRSVEKYFEELNTIRSRIQFKPDVNIYFHDDFESCLSRVQKREGRRFRADEVEFMRRAHEYFPRLLEDHEDVYTVDISGKGDEKVVSEVGETIEYYSQT